MMSNDEEFQRRQLESMTTTEITARMEENQREQNTFLEQLVTRSSLQEYTERQCDELLALVQEALTFIEGVSPLPLEWVGRRNELIVKLRKKL